MKHAKPNRRLFIRVICAAASCLLPVFSCGLGDQMPRERKFLGATALKGSTPRDIESLAIPNLKEESVRNVAISDGVKNAQAKSMFGGSDVRTFELRDENVMVVPLHAFRRGDYVGIRIYVENLSSQSIDLLSEASRLYARGAATAVPAENESSEITDPTGIEAIVIGFDRESEVFKLLDNGDGPTPDFNGLHVSGYGAQALANLGCQPYNDFKSTDVIYGLPTIEIPAGKHAIVNFCFLPESKGNQSLNVVMRGGSSTGVTGFRIDLGK